MKLIAAILVSMQFMVMACTPGSSPTTVPTVADLNATEPVLEITSKNQLHLGVEQKEPRQFAVGSNFSFLVTFANQKPNTGGNIVTLGTPSLAGAGAVEILRPEDVVAWKGRTLKGAGEGDQAELATWFAFVTARCARAGGGEYGVILSAVDEAGEETVLTGSGAVECVEFTGDNRPTPVATEDSLAPTPGIEFLDPTATPSGQAAPLTTNPSGLVFIDPCEAVNPTIAEAILGYPVEAGTTDVRYYRDKEAQVSRCGYGHEEAGREYFWVAGLRVDAGLAPSRGLTDQNLPGGFFTQGGWNAEMQDFIVFRDEEGLLADKLSTGTVVTVDGDAFDIGWAEDASNLSGTVVMKRSGKATTEYPPSAGWASVEVAAKVPGYDIWVIVTVSLTEPWDPPGPQAELEAFLKAMPPMSEYEWRALELAGFLVKAAELAQLRRL